MELDEVEHYLRIDPLIRHGAAFIPARGFCEKRLVAVLSIKELASFTSAIDGLKVVKREASSIFVDQIRERLREKLPAYMVPSNWALLEHLPLLASGKLDRRKTERWVEDMSPEVYHQISHVEARDETVGATTMEQKLQQIWATALNLSAEHVGLHQSFLSIGGDSMSAMQVMATSRSQGLGITVRDIISSKSISDLAKLVAIPEDVSFEGEETNREFALSPMQDLFYECVGEQCGHFNQSMMLRLTKRVDPVDVQRAVEILVTTHSMLRARFNKNDAGVQTQMISPDVSSSYRFEYRTTTKDAVENFVKDSQMNLDIQSGPVFSVLLFDVDGKETQLLSLVAHHLVIDVVSWQIVLHDFEYILSTDAPKLQASLPFQIWSRLQAEHAQQPRTKNLFHPEDVPVPDLDYWGMMNKPNFYGDTVEDGFEIDTEVTGLILGACNNSLHTEPVDIFLGAVLASFAKVFSDRPTLPAIYNEGHGREPWTESKIDISRTVGWFTTMCPVYLPNNNADNELMNLIRWIKDLRNRIPDKGRPYFSYRLLTDEGRERFSSHWPMEMTFNYLGKLQNLGSHDGMLQRVDSNTANNFDIGANVPRFALFEISAEVANGSLRLSFSYNRRMKRQPKIRRWIVECQRSLQEASQRLVELKPQRTLSDFPLLPLAYNGITNITDKLPLLGVTSLEDVEDVYPCSGIQQGMLIAQLKQPDLYAYAAVFEVHSQRRDQFVNAILFAEAWRDVVQRHATLRTIFIQSISQTTLMDQVVIKVLVPRIAWITCEDSQAATFLSEQPGINFRDIQAPHRLTICKTNSDRVFCKLELSHAISDGTSIPILLRDLSSAYQARLPSAGVALIDTVQPLEQGLVENRTDIAGLPHIPVPTPAPLYSDYIAHIQSKSQDEDVNYWKAYLAGIEQCHFPSLTDGERGEKELRSVVLDLAKPSELQSFCSKNGVTLSNILQLTWALTLRSYTGSTDVCFGYLSSGRDVPIPNIQGSAVGAFINMLTCRMSLIDDLQLSEALQQIQSDFVHGMAHQSCSLADVQHELGLSGASLFNTAFTFQKRQSSAWSDQSLIVFDVIETHDPSEYDVTVNVEAFETEVKVHFGYWGNILSETQARNMADTFGHVVNTVVSSQISVSTVGTVDFLTEQSREQINIWNCSLPPKVDRCIHEMIARQKVERPMATQAVCAWDGDLTLTELDEMTTRLVPRLLELGVGPEVYVPLCFEKSKFAVVAMIAVMKAGG